MLQHEMAFLVRLAWALDGVRDPIDLSVRICPCKPHAHWLDIYRPSVRLVYWSSYVQDWFVTSRPFVHLQKEPKHCTFTLFQTENIFTFTLVYFPSKFQFIKQHNHLKLLDGDMYLCPFTHHLPWLCSQQYGYLIMSWKGLITNPRSVTMTTSYPFYDEYWVVPAAKVLQLLQ